MPTVYRVEGPISEALPGDHLVYWGGIEWTLQRQVKCPSDKDMTYLKRLHHNPPPGSHAEEQPRPLPWSLQLKGGKPAKAPQTPN